MQDIILHHYPASPYSEKIRLVLGFKGLTWRSVIIPAVMPKPDVMALTGGHRRTPLLQMGSHIYCDTALICRVIEQIAPTPTIYPFGHTLAIEALTHFADEVLVGVRPPISTMRAEDLSRFFPGRDAGWLEGYRKDRIAMRKGAAKAKSQAEPSVMFAYLAPRLEAQLDDGRFFLLGNVPCVADFAVYHTFWIIEHLPALFDALSNFPRIIEWTARMKAFGHGQFTEMSAIEAIEVAKASEAAAIGVAEAFEVNGVALGDLIEVVPTDHEADAGVRGELLNCSIDEIAVRRTDPRAGVVIVHFPRLGYRVRKPAVALAE